MKELKNYSLSSLLDIDYPIILAPMFLVSNTEMIIEALNSGITGAIPALNFRTIDELRKGIKDIKSKSNKSFGINLIANKSNFYLEEQLNVCCEEKVGFIITSLGSPKTIIEKAHQNGIKVFCDVTDLKYALKVQEMNADAVIAVNKEAGGHAGHLSYNELIPLLKQSLSIPVISAGGVSTGKDIKKMLDLGAEGISMGSVFIASEECGVSQEYKQACIDFGAKDIVMTTKLSGTPCTVIKTPYIEKIGTKQNFLERILNKNKRLKKWVKALTFYKGMKSLEKAAFSATYKSVWCAGPSIENVKEILPINKIVSNLIEEYKRS